MKKTLAAQLIKALESACAAGDLPPVDAVPEFVVEKTKQAEHGDLASNLAMQLARPCRKSPRQIAEILLTHLGQGNGLIERTEIAGPGFINFFLNPAAWHAVLPQILAQGPEFGRGDWGAGAKVQVEFVSANPTGPLHVGHGRGAALGDALARVLAFSGFDAQREYYLNDAGNQMATLGRSVLVRARQLKGSDEPFPDKHYKGEYINGLAAELLATPEGKGLLEMPQDQAVALASQWAGQKILDGIKDDLAAFHVSIDSYFSERSLVTDGAVERAFAALREKGLLYEAEGALWFKATEFGDEKDRVVKRSNGEITYFASDIAYHLDKFRRGFGRLVDVWGADHHGYVPRLKASLAGLGREPEDLTVVLVQMVNLLRNGEPVAMSTRGGEFVTLREVVDEVGGDSARFIFLTRRSDAQLDFDLEVAKAQSLDNPVFYVQYAHTRVSSILRKAEAESVPLPDPAATSLDCLTLAPEVELAKRLAEFPELVEGAAKALEPHRITYYLHELAGAFHSYYNAAHVLVEDPALSAARLVLTQAVGRVLANGLELLGVSAPEKM
ncbi:MAG: arginine--tRNA ligase [Desulfarculus sp.]|nr:arginine--tRNA ligase [Pseudomonadota bacterium]MBV1715382.1 arginine--tRNA ligase [Desulfarculus sp.]MBU4573977.1 arginine--tRNA ligase [Pseudomonadota bacterium]MBU4596271.1 arginine--tRNA ligase [Pseudomonadota bacterium]MBV1737577.1 arginine--tRNA ligase [Desulfarculus sp.]